MHLWKHPDSGRWYARTAEGRVSLKTKERSLALSRLEDMRKAPKGALIISDMEVYLSEKRGKASHEQMQIAWRNLKPFFGHLRHDQVTRQHCRDYIIARSKNVRPGTIGRELSVVIAAVRYSHPHSPAKWEVPPAAPPRDRRITKEEFKRLIEVCDIPHVKLFITLALSTGGRSAAILQLTWDRVLWDRGLVDLRIGGHRGKGRAIVPMTPLAKEALEAARSIAQTENVIEYGGQKVGSVKRGFARAVKMAGLEKVTPHVLRHTAASWMAEASVPMPEIAAFLGHSDSRITERVYAKYSPGFLRGAMTALHI